MDGSYRLNSLAVFGFLFAVMALLLLLCLMPVFFVAAMQQALQRLHLSPPAALFSVLAIVIGGLINVPVYRVQRPHVVVEVRPPFPIPPFLVPVIRSPEEVVIALNVGGAIVPGCLAAWELLHLIAAGPEYVAAAVAATVITGAICYLLAQPVPGVGIALPLVVPAGTSLLATWALLGFQTPAAYRAPVAFVAGVVGTLVGADLLHLRDVTRLPVNLVVIGGAGTFDGIVLTGILAALLA